MNPAKNRKKYECAIYIIFHFYLRGSSRKNDIAHCKRVPSVNSCLGEVAELRWSANQANTEVKLLNKNALQRHFGCL